METQRTGKALPKDSGRLRTTPLSNTKPVRSVNVKKGFYPNIVIISGSASGSVLCLFNAFTQALAFTGGFIFTFFT